MSKIKFGTDGWRAIIAKDYTVDNVSRIAEATGRWMLNKGMSKAVIGYDCRFGGRMFADQTARVLGNFNIQVHMSPGFVSTPMVSLGVVKTGADMGIVITASHNPPSYNGFKLKSSYGGPTIPAEIAEIEGMIPSTPIMALPTIEELREKDILDYVDLETMYIDHIKDNFDLETIQQSGVKIAYDAMYGAGQNVMKKLFSNQTLLHCDYNPSFMDQAPEPIERNLKELQDVIIKDSNISLGIANDGDADRIGMFDEDGKFVDSHHILLLLLYYMYEYKRATGKVIYTFSVTEKMKKLADIYGLESECTKIGFKYIAEIMIDTDVLVGGEESGGLAVKGHIPERDGVWIGLMIMEFMAKTGKSIKTLIQEVYDKVGSFNFERDDHPVNNDLKVKIMEDAKAGKIKSIGGRPIVRTEDIDGYKFFFENEDWLMVRASGTEPVLRVYAQTADYTSTRKLLDQAYSELIATN
jgi:phosphomannomutase